MRLGRCVSRFQRVVAVVTFLLGTILLIVGCGRLDAERLAPACPLGSGHGQWDPGSLLGEDKDAGADSEAKKLLDHPNFGASPEAARDLEKGIVDDRLVATLRVVTREHPICVGAFKEGHFFIPGVPDGPRIPEGYGKAGGLPNTHYYGRAADIWWVAGKPVEGNATAPEILDVGRILASIPAQQRPDQIIGPPRWAKTLGYGRVAGWVLEADQLRLHRDHLHVGFVGAKGTRNER